jgi:hypothetical protein
VLGFHELWECGTTEREWRDSTREGMCWGGSYPLHTLVLLAHHWDLCVCARVTVAVHPLALPQLWLPGTSSVSGYM